MDYRNYSAEELALDDLFIAYVKEPNEELEEYWEGWISDNPDRVEAVNLARQMVEAIQFKEQHIPESEIDHMVDKINQTIDRKEQASGPASRRSKFWMMKIAAGLALVAAAVWTFQLIRTDKGVKLAQQEVKYVTKEIPVGKKCTVTLADGTKVKINSGSTLRFPETFSDTIREVYLTGEAFFDVAKNPDKPFVIHSGGVDTRVLGTSFNIKAYPSTPNVSVAVATGKVKVNLTEDQKRSEVLIPNQMYFYDKSKDMAIKAELINLADVVAWKDKRIVFNKSLQDEIIETLERWYGVKFVVNKDLNTGTGYTAKFKPNESLQATLDHMKYTLGFEYKLENDIVTLN